MKANRSVSFRHLAAALSLVTALGTLPAGTAALADDNPRWGRPEWTQQGSRQAGGGGRPSGDARRQGPAGDDSRRGSAWPGPPPDDSPAASRGARPSRPGVQAPPSRPGVQGRDEARRDRPPVRVVRTRPAPRFRGPHVDTYVPALPGRPNRVVVHGGEYFFHGGHFYRHHPRGYVMVDAPLGAVVVSLPIGFRTFLVAGVTYYMFNHICYRAVSSGYEVVAPPPGAPDDDAATAPTVVNGDTVSVAVDRLNVRTGPGGDFPVSRVIPYGTVLRVVGGSPGWLYVNLPSGDYGWVMTDWVIQTEAPPQG